MAAVLTADDLVPFPSTGTSMWRVLKRGYVSEPWLLSIAFVLTVVGAIPDALFALWLALLAHGLTNSDPVWLWTGSLGMGLSATLNWAIKVVSDRTQRQFRDRVAIALETHVAQLQATVSTIAHQERPEYLDRLSVLRDQVFTLDHMYMSLFSTVGWFLRLGVTLGLLFYIDPLLVLLLLFALPTVVSASWRPAVERATEEAHAQSLRLSKHLFDLATSPTTARETRVCGIDRQLVSDRSSAWQRWYKPVASARSITAIFHSISWAIFGLGFVLAVVYVVYGIEASTGETLLVLAAGSRLSSYISATVGELGFLRGIWMDGSKRLAWLEDYSDHVASIANQKPPETIKNNIELKKVSFAYPGTQKLVLEDVSLKLKAGTVVALVGENGAGKTTLVKLLAKMYEPSSGQINVDEHELSRIASAAWRARLAGAFQDFFKFEFAAKRSVGLGDPQRETDESAVDTAVARAGAESVIEQLPRGIDTQLGVTWPDGVEVSHGQWQKLALARGFMRDEPLLLVLDEPTATLDAETEHALFEQYSKAAKDEVTRTTGRITILVSHRFSTVRMADQIVVLDGSKVAEVGSHDELMQRDGQYAELYNMQAEAYR